MKGVPSRPSEISVMVGAGVAAADSPAPTLTRGPSAFPGMQMMAVLQRSHVGSYRGTAMKLPQSSKSDASWKTEDSSTAGEGEVAYVKRLAVEVVVVVVWMKRQMR